MFSPDPFLFIELGENAIWRRPGGGIILTIRAPSVSDQWISALEIVVCMGGTMMVGDGGDPWLDGALSRWAGRSSQGSYDTARVWTLSTLCNLPYCAPMRPAVVSCSDFLIM